MSNGSNTTRTLVVVVAAVAVAAGVGYLIGESRGPAPAPVAGAPAPAAAPAPQPVIPETAPASSEPASPAPAAPAPRYEPGQRVSRPRPAEEPAPSYSEPAPAPAPAPAPPLVVPDGTRVELRLTTPVSSQTAAVGQTVEAELGSPVVVDGRTAIPTGARVSGRVTEVHALRKVGGRAHLAFTFDTLEVAGGSVPIEASFARTGKSETGKDAATIAAGAVVGTVLGNQSRHNDRGKVLGGLLGAGVGTAIAAATPGEKIELPAGTRLELTLHGDVEIPRAD